MTQRRYGVSDPKLRLFRYGVQVNSLGLTEQQPENNVYRILFGMLGVTLSKNARARAVQLPAWNEALGLPRPWDQQWSLRLQQIGAFETDMLEYDDIFDGSHVIEDKVGAAVGADSRGNRAHRSAGRRRLAGGTRIYEGAPGPLQCRAHRGHRDRGGDSRRRQRLYGDGSLAAHGGQRELRRRRSAAEREQIGGSKRGARRATQPRRRPRWRPWKRAA